MATEGRHCQDEALTVWLLVFNPETDRLELDDQAKYYSYLAKSGLTGLVILGTNAETFLLTVSSQAQRRARRGGEGGGPPG